MRDSMWRRIRKRKGYKGFRVWKAADAEYLVATILDANPSSPSRTALLVVKSICSKGPFWKHASALVLFAPGMHAKTMVARMFKINRLALIAAILKLLSA